MAFDSLPKRFPSADASHLKALVEVWTEELNRIIKRMLDISAAEGGTVMPEGVRHEAIFELAKLILWLEEQIIEKKTGTASIESLDPQAERAALASPEVSDRIENTARICADRIWKPLQDQWHRSSPLIIAPGQTARKKGRLVEPDLPGVQRQHYSPTFSNKHWASGRQNKVRVYYRGVDHKVKSRDVGYKTWGQESFLYSQQLERLFGLIEGDASAPYYKLLNTVPLSEEDCRHWIAYLTAQLLRTPSYIAKSFPKLRRMIYTRNIDYPDDIASLRRGYETLFTNDDVFASFYRQIVGRQWEIWLAPTGVEFVRSDDPVLVEGSTRQGTWRLIYPLTPAKCFVAGPERSANPPTVVPVNKSLNQNEAWSLNERIAKGARRTVIARIAADDSSLKSLLESSLGIEWTRHDLLSEVFPEYWGDIK